MQKQLTKDELEEYNKIKDTQFNPNQVEAANLCLSYYLNYRQNISIPSDKISLAFKCAFFMAEKSQFSVNLKGEKIRGISFSLNKLLKDHKLDDTMFMLKQMTRKISFIDADTNNYLNNIVKEISFLITLHSKFQKTFSQKLQLKQRVNDGGNYAKIFTSYAWLLFIIAKNEVLKRSLQLLPNTCMVAHIISMMLIVSWDYIRPQALMRTDKRLNQNSTQRQIKTLIKQKVLEIFCIKDLNQYKKVANQFQQHFRQLMKHGLIKMDEDKMDFLSPDNVHSNYGRLDKYYQRKLNMEHLDQRIFFKQRAMNLTPSKFTPFARQGYVNKFQKPTIGNKLGGPQKPSKEQTFNSHRVLNYEAIQKQVQTKTIPIHDIKLPKNIIQSPSMVKVPLVMATPISTGMQMYNYINEKKKKIRQIHSQERSLDKNIFILIDQIFDLQGAQNDKINKDTKLQMIVALYKIFSGEYLSTNPHEKDTPELMRAFLGLSMELVFFVSNISLSFEVIEEQLKVQPFQMWKAIDYFLKSDKSIPFPIKLHFLDLQVNLISFKIWQNMDMVIKICNFGNKALKQMTQAQAIYIEKLFKRTVHQVAFQITRLTTQLEIDESTSQKIFDVMKQILTNHPDMLYKRHIDQLIICSIYVNCKGVYKIMFNQIRQYYTASNPNLKDIIQDIFVHVLLYENKYDDLIVFYNQIFIKNQNLKDFIVNNRNSGSTTGNTSNTLLNKNNKKNTLLMSPLKAIIPKQINFKSKNLIGNNNNMNGKGRNGNMTPQTQLLYAYNESPILKYEVNTFKGPLKSKKVLTFEQQEQKVKNRSHEQQFGAPIPRTNENTLNINPNSHTTSANNYQSTNDFINRKYARKATTPTNQMHSNQPTQSNHQHVHGHAHTHSQVQQMHLPLQNITKQNLNPPISSNSHRTLFDQKKQCYGRDQPINKNYQFGAFRRQ